MTHIGLFEGIGGFSLAARWMGWKTIAWCEWNEFGQKVLKYNFPKATGHGDIKKTDFTIYRGQCDILTGGFPCQPYSMAGKRLGKEDDRHLWPEMLRAIREIQPCYVVGENVSGLTNWNGGVVFDEVQADLENEGYEVLPFLLPACAVNAPHRRDRIWFIAYSISARTRRKSGTTNNEGRRTGKDWGESIRQTYGQAGTSGINATGTNERVTTNTNYTRANNHIGINGKREKENEGWDGQPQFEHRKDGGNGYATNTESRRLQKWDAEQAQYGAYATIKRHDSFSRWQDFPTQPPICSRDDGISPELVGITVSKHRNESIKAYGNSVVPQLVLQIFKAIQAMENK